MLRCEKKTSVSLLAVVLGLLFFLPTFFVAADTYQQAPIKLSTSANKVSISQSAEFILLDQSLSVQDVASEKYQDQWSIYHGQGIAAFGDKNELWLRFKATTQTQDATAWWLVISWPVLSHAKLSVHSQATNTWQHYPAMGLSYPRSNRIVKDRNLIFPLNINEGTDQTYYLNVNSQSLLSVPISFWKSENFILWNHIDLLTTGAILGALLIMLLYNISLSILLKDDTYWYYCIYVASVIVYLVASTGIGPYYLWPDSTWLIANGIHLSAIICFSTATVFVRHFLRLQDHGGWLLWGNNLLLFMWSVIAFSIFVAPIYITELLLNLTAFGSTAIAIATGVVLWRRSFPTAKIFVLSWGVLIVGTIIFVSAIQGAIPFNTFTRYSQLVGFAIELVMLSVALAYRINMEIHERELAQSEALMLTKKVSEERRERLKAQMETLDMQRHLNEELEQHVVERTEQLNDAMVKLESANAELTKLSVTDPLTKLHNRRFFDDTLINEFKRALRSHQPLGIIVADIDYFKSINDTYGHSVGDTCIAQVADALKHSVHRPGDLVARYGGEEFVLVLPGSDEKNAVEVANNCRAAVEALTFECDGKSIPLTISAGVAAWIPSEEGAYKQLLNAADTALYRAKNSGRNCVKTASERGKLARI